MEAEANNGREGEQEMTSPTDMNGAEKQPPSSPQAKQDVAFSIEVAPATSATAPIIRQADTPQVVVMEGESCCALWCNKGSLSNLCTFVIMLLGIFLQIMYAQHKEGTPFHLSQWVLAFGLFGFAGGITNWLAVHMLFEEVWVTPWHSLYGSGVIPKRFKEIREVVKSTIMRTFFDKAYLDKYMSSKMGALTDSLNLEDKIRQLLESPQVDTIIDVKLENLVNTPEGMMIVMMGITPDTLKPMVKPFILGLGIEVAPMLVAMLQPAGSSGVNVEKLRDEVDELMTEKLQELTPRIVKKLMEDVIRKHLGWLIVWGNIFGGLLGVISKACGYG